MRRFRKDDAVTSPDTNIRYVIGSKLGEGGFGEVYRAEAVGARKGVPRTVCLKVSDGIEGWLQEAYFSRLLEGDVRVVRVYEAFAACRPNRSLLYCLALEYAAQGDLTHYLRSHGALAESVARREITAIVKVLLRLHRGQALHRDLTPFNILVTKNGQLKVGDFGIAKHQQDRRGVPAGTFNPFGAPESILGGEQRQWQAKDDLYQVGQLLAMLVRGNADVPVSTRDVRELPCTDHLKEVIHRCLGVRHRRYQTASELLKALSRAPQPLRPGRLESLDGVHLAFTGKLRVPRREAMRRARAAGAVVHAKPSRQTTIVVRGRPNRQQVAGPDAGLKLMEIKRLRDAGYDIRAISEAQFWRLTKS